MISKTLRLLNKVILFVGIACWYGQVVGQELSAHLSVADLSKLQAGHPRILLLAGEERGLMDQVQKYPEWQAVHGAILKDCNKIIELPTLTRIQTGRRLLSVSRECLRRVFQLAYAYRTTNNAAYLKRAEQEMLAVARFSDWNPSHFLDVAEMTMAVAIGYDWLYNHLADSTRDTLRTILAKNIGLSFDSKNNRFVTSEHNWNQVCNAGMVFGALAIAEREPELALNVINRAINSVPKAMVASYKPDGAYPEGYAYWEYGTSFNVLLISALEKAMGSDYGLSSTPGFLKTASFIQNITGPNNLVHNWGDCGDKVAGFSPASFWFAVKNGDFSILFSQKKYMTPKEADVQVGNRLLPAALVWGTKMGFSDLKVPVKKVWIGQGTNPVGFMRTSWTDPNAIYVGFKAGTPGMSHGQMDVGSFVLDADGERWAMDFGSQNYNSLESKGVKVFGLTQDAQRWQIFRYNNLVHNTLTVDGQLQRVDGYAKIDSWLDSPRRLSVISDITGVYNGQLESARRGVAIVDNREVVIRDEVKTLDKTTELRWTLLTAASTKILDANTIELNQNGKTMYLMFDAKIPFTLKTWSTQSPNDYDEANPGTTLLGFETTIPAGIEQHFNVCFSKERRRSSKIQKLDDWKRD